MCLLALGGSMVLLVFAITNALAALTLLEQLTRCGMADLSAREKPTNCCPRHPQRS